MQEYLKRLQELKKRGLTVNDFVDVGANQGVATEMLLSVWPKAHVTMLEPLPQLQSKLQKLCDRHPGQVTLVHGGAGNVTGTMPFHYSPDDADLAGSTFARREVPAAEQWFNTQIEVPMYRLDDLYTSHQIRGVPDFLKVDAEGIDLEVLTGASSFLGKTPLLHLELTLFPSFIKHPSFAMVCGWLQNKGYVLYELGDLGRRPHDGALMVVDGIFCLESHELRRHPFWS